LSRACPNKAAAFHNEPSRFTAWRLFVSLAYGSFEIVLVFERLDHVASSIVNANHGTWSDISRSKEYK